MTEKIPNNTAQLVKDAKDLYQAGKYLAAADSFSKAASVYIELEEESLAAEMKNNQCVSLLQANQPQSALEVVKGTSEVFDLAGDRLKMAMALANEGTALKELGCIDQATGKFSKALVIFKEIGETDLLVQTSQSLSSLKLKSRNIPGALFSMQQGLEAVNKPNLRQKILLNLLKIPNKLLDR